jgi:hypothetical protein
VVVETSNFAAEALSRAGNGCGVRGFERRVRPAGVDVNTYEGHVSDNPRFAVEQVW